MAKSSTSGRGKDGKFTTGNKCGQGNPHSRHVGKLRSTLLSTVDEKAVRDVVKSLIQAARNGDIQAARLLLDRVFGPAVAVDVIERIEALEATLEGMGKS